MSAPATIELVSAQEFSLESGWAQIECPDVLLNEFTVKTRDAELRQFENAQLHLQVDSRGSEVLLARGSLELNRFDSSSRSKPLSLELGELNHAFVNNSVNNLQTKAPSFVIAHGQNKYLGQIGIDDEMLDANSPEEFEAIIEDSQQEQADNQNEDQVQHFNELFRQIRGQFPNSRRGANGFSPPFEMPLNEGGFSFGTGRTPSDRMKNFRELSEQFFDRNAGNNNDKNK